VELAARVARDVADAFGDVLELRRFPLGLCHYVYDVTLADGTSLVVRVASPENAPLLAGAVAWHEVLSSIGVPLPAVLEAGLGPDSGELAYLVLERLPGTDLGEVYADLGAPQRRNIARSVAEIERVVGKLPLGRGFGYARSPAGPFPHREWAEVIRENLARSRSRMERSGPSLRHDRVEILLEESATYLDCVQPIAFLDDLTTKNVLIHEGVLSGVVDVDHVCFGDPLLTPALTRVSLAAGGHDLDYIDEWLAHVGVDGHQRRAFDLYTAVFVLDLLSEADQQFNQDQPVVVSVARANRLGQLFESLVP